MSRRRMAQTTGTTTRTRTAAAAVLTAVAGLVTGLLPPGPAGATTGTTGTTGTGRDAVLEETPVPSHLADSTRLWLYGGSTHGGVVRQIAEHDSRILAGPTGHDLKITDSQGMQLELLGTVGKIAGWTATSDPDDPVSAQQLHRMNVVTGAETVTDPPDEPLATTRDGWIGYADGRLVAHTMAGGSKVLLRGLTARPGVVADATHALVASNHEATKPRRTIFRLRLVTLGTGKVRTLQTGTDGVYGPAFSSSTVAWYGDPDPKTQHRTIYHRPRDGSGKTRRYVEPNWPQSPLAVAGKRVGWLGYRTLASGQAWFMRVFTGSKAKRIDLPGTANGVSAAGTRILTAVSGKLTTAGGYAVDTKARRVLTAPAAETEYSRAALSAGRLWLTDNALSDRQGRPIWERTLSGDGAPVLSQETRIALQAGTWQRISLSAGRALSGHPASDGRYRIIDRGKVTHTFRLVSEDEEQLESQASGPYFSFGYWVYDADGTRLVNVFEDGIGSIRLYGSLMLHYRDNGLWVRDLAKPLSGSNPVRVTQDCGGCSQLSIWGTTVAWLTRSGRLNITTVGGDDVRSLELGTEVFAPQLSEGAVTWRERVNGDEYVAHTLDLTSPASQPVALGHVDPLAVDGHWLVARRTMTPRRVSVMRLPFGGDQPGRLIGTWAKASFTPDAGAWAPEFDISKPMVDVRLRIRDDEGRTVRTLTGTAPDGSIRDLSWDGRSDGGTPADAGTYSWELTAANADGEGQLIDVDGGAGVTGTVALT